MRKAYRRLALRFHPDKAMAAVKMAAGVPGAAGEAPHAGPIAAGVVAEVEARVRNEAAWLFNFINQVRTHAAAKGPHLMLPWCTWHVTLPFVSTGTS